jgi:hypothetical protein
MAANERETPARPGVRAPTPVIDEEAAGTAPGTAEPPSMPLGTAAPPEDILTGAVMAEDWGRLPPEPAEDLTPGAIVSEETGEVLSSSSPSA